MSRIPFNRPFIVGKELYYIARPFKGGTWPETEPLRRSAMSGWEREFGAKKVLLTHSCTAAWICLPCSVTLSQGTR